MKKVICVLVLAVGGTTMGQNKLVLTPYGEKILHQPVMTTAQRDVLATPYVGYMIYNSTTNCLEHYNGVKGWYNYCWQGYVKPLEVSTGGTAIVSVYTCVTASAGTMTVGVAVSGVTQTITANVGTVGTYAITTTVSGVTFAATGTFTATGNQNIVLTATGTPTAAGSYSFNLNTSPGCSFSRTINSNMNLSTGGTAIVASYSCSTASVGILTAGGVLSNVLQTITANVTTIGTYAIASTANGVTFTGAGTFTALGNQNIILTASGIPTASGIHSFTLNTTPGCGFNRTTEPGVGIVVGAAGKTWMDKNLGASRIATAVTDYQAYGSLYQWGRESDGHQLITRTSSSSGTPVNGTTTILEANYIKPNHNLFILNPTGSNWLVPGNITRWVGVNAENNPCPDGFRVPYMAEWDAEWKAANIVGRASAYASPLKLIPAGHRSGTTGLLYDVGVRGDYWAADRGFYTQLAYEQVIQDGWSDPDWEESPHANGMSVRCIKD